MLAWEATMAEVIKDDAANVGLASRTLAMVSGAIYDAVNDIERTGSVYKFDLQAPAGASPLGRRGGGGLYRPFVERPPRCSRFSR